MIDAYKRFWNNYTNFSGRSTRSDYWYVLLINIIIGAVLGFLGGLLNISSITLVLVSIYSLVALVPSIALFVRRLHDINKSGFWAFITFVPLVGEIILLVFLLTPSVDVNNKYGERAM